MRFGGRRPRSGDTKRSEEKELALAREFGVNFARIVGKYSMIWISKKTSYFAFPQIHFQISVGVGEGEELFGCIWYKYRLTCFEFCFEKKKESGPKTGHKFR